MIPIPIFRVISLSAALCISPAEWAQYGKDPAMEGYFVANAAYNRKLCPVAIGQYESFLKKHAAHPKADLANQGAGLSQKELKQYERAMPHFAALLAKDIYNATLALYLHRGPFWHAWNEKLKEVLPLVHRKDGAESGSWDPQGNHMRADGRVISTAFDPQPRSVLPPPAHVWLP